VIDFTEVKTIAIAVLAAALIFLGAAYWRSESKRDEKKAADVKTADDIKAQLADLQSKMLMLGVAVQPFTAAYAAMLVKSLTHARFPDADALLAKVGPPNTLSRREEVLLVDIMESRTKDADSEISDLERNAAQLLPLIIERSRLEGADMKHMDLALVGVSKAHE
jgi:hypothetical protein